MSLSKVHKKHLQNFSKKFFFLGVLITASCLAFSDSRSADNINYLLSLNLEELTDYEIEAATKTVTSLADSPGAVSVITYDQIQQVKARNNQHQIQAGLERHRLKSGNHHAESFDDEQAVTSDHKISAYIQDQFASENDQLSLTLGTRYDSAASPDLFDVQDRLLLDVYGKNQHKNEAIEVLTRVSDEAPG